MSNNQKGIFYAMTTALLWGFLPIALKVAARQVEPITIVWFRFLIAFIFLSCWQLIRSPKSFHILHKPPLLLVFAALALSWNYMGFMLGIHKTSPSNAQLIIQTGPITLAIAGIFLFKEKINLKQITGFVLAILGFYFFYNQQIRLMVGQESQYNTGILFTFSGAMAWAVYAILQKRLVQNHPTSTLNLFLFGMPVLLYLPFINFTPLLSLSWEWWLLLLFLGLNTLIAYSSISQALKFTEANKVSIIIILNPMITFIVMGILSYIEVSWINPEKFSIYSILGAAVVLVGAILVAGKKQKKTTARS